MKTFTVVELGDALVDFDVKFAQWVIWLFAAREYAEQEDFCFILQYHMPAAGLC